MKLSGVGWKRLKNDPSERAKFSPVRPERCAGSSDFPKRPILTHPGASLCCKRRHEAVVCQFRTGTDSSNPLPSATESQV
jgi:hypothetical protein